MPSRKPKAGKLFSLKEWLSLEDAARHLSLLFDEEVTVPDVLRLGLDHRLTLSVWFVNHTYARKGKLVPLSECQMRILPNLDLKDLKGWRPDRRLVTQDELTAIYPTIKEAVEAGDIYITPDAIHYTDDDQWLVLEKEVKSISGIWDLPVLAGEQLDIEHRYQMETGGPAITLENLEGAFVERDGVVCQLQEDFEDNQFQSGSKAYGQALEMRIFEEELSKEDASQLRNDYSEQRKKFLDGRRDRPREDRYYPAGGLPEDAVLVVRTAALREFEQAIFEQDSVEKPLGKREETTLLNITGALLGLLLGKTPSGKSQSVFKDQQAVIDALLARHEGKPGIAKRTLEKKFAEAKRSLTST